MLLFLCACNYQYFEIKLQVNFIIAKIYNINNTQMNDKLDKHLQWYNCNLSIKKYIGDSQTNFQFESLSPSMGIGTQDGDQQRDFSLQISLLRQFKYQQQNGLIWHKSWNIPEIRAQINAQDYQLFSQLKKRGNVICEITSACLIKSKSYYLQEIPLEGKTRKTVTNGKISFSYLKFRKTSFNVSKKRIHLVIRLYVADQKNEKISLKSYISSSIYVDSRKEARKKVDNVSILKQNQGLRFCETPCLRVNGYQLQFQNNAEYLVSYYMAQNIRNKIKHPYFLAYHFNQIVKIYYNKEYSKDQQELLQNLYNNKSKQKKIMKLFFNFYDSSQKKKILKLFQSWKCMSIEIFFEWQLHKMQDCWVLADREKMKEAFLKNQHKINGDVIVKYLKQDPRENQGEEYEYKQQIIIQKGKKVQKIVSKIQQPYSVQLQQ